jgi:hypothetical protein
LSSPRRRESRKNWIPGQARNDDIEGKSAVANKRVRVNIAPFKNLIKIDDTVHTRFSNSKRKWIGIARGRNDSSGRFGVTVAENFVDNTLFSPFVGIFVVFIGKPAVLYAK